MPSKNPDNMIVSVGIFAAKADGYLGRHHFILKAREAIDHLSPSLFQKWKAEARDLGIPESAIVETEQDKAIADAAIEMLDCSIH